MEPVKGCENCAHLARKSSEEPCRACGLGGCETHSIPNMWEPKDASAIASQIGGNHYKTMPIQPLEFFMANRMEAPEAKVIKYVCRWRHKAGVQDLEKAAHMLSVMIERAKSDPEYCKPRSVK